MNYYTALMFNNNQLLGAPWCFRGGAEDWKLFLYHTYGMIGLIATCLALLKKSLLDPPKTPWCTHKLIIIEH